ncbi:MAG TPA: hypothetical protein DIT54_04450, partial [Lachnospiraceae bacterium]|nr:hypothetical protein [Lachnospiraceae bacterium]
FMRKTRRKGEMLLVICNFTPVAHEQYKIGVPYEGKYKEIFTSDAIEFGGSGEYQNKRMRHSKKEECDKRKHSMKVT